jgi:hypothetical protein
VPLHVERRFGPACALRARSAFRGDCEWNDIGDLGQPPEGLGERPVPVWRRVLVAERSSRVGVTTAAHQLRATEAPEAAAQARPRVPEVVIKPISALSRIASFCAHVRARWSNRCGISFGSSPVSSTDVVNCTALVA